MKNTLKKFAFAFFAFVMVGTSAKAQDKETIELSGYVIGYDADTKNGCFFVDENMVEQGIAKDISSNTNKSCNSSKYGKGATINFDEVPTDADYTTPKENTLMSFQGQWIVKDDNKTFVVSSFEPFF